MEGKLAALIALLLMFTMSFTAIAYAHGTKIEYMITTTITVHAKFDTDEPMSEAQIMVYAPDDPSTPWLVDTADEDGYFTFTTDPELPGIWDVQVRQAGHGDMIHIPVGEDAPTMGSSGLTPPQILLMGACVIWGFIGTAFYFSRRKT